jgi:feruloyl esterase
MIFIGWVCCMPALAIPRIAPRDCSAVVSMPMTGAKVLSSELIDADRPATTFAPDLAAKMHTMPAFCRVVLQASPATGSKIGIELWLPTDTWNGRFLGTGNGGAAGSIAYGMGMIEGLKRGFAVANTDMGMPLDAKAADLNHEVWKDFGYRATHEMTRIGKAIVGDFYNAGFHSYFEGCSTGGQQALSEAQRFPTDYDGILAGDPGGNRTHSTAYFIWLFQAVNASPASRLSAAQWQYVTSAVLDACGGRDGGAPDDRFLTDPRACRLDIAKLRRCPPPFVQDTCITDAQAVAIQKLYAGPSNPRTRERIYAGLTPGSEALPLGPVRMNDPNIAQKLFVLRWGLGSTASAEAFDFDGDQGRLDTELAAILNTNTADLAPFARRGGKIILYNGLADPGVPFTDTLDYYTRVLRSAGGRSGRAFARLFLVPGMGHCLGGPGPTEFGQPFSPDVSLDPAHDALMALVAWTEDGTAPEELVARKSRTDGSIEIERPLCAYPKFPAYRSGDPTKRSNFVCRARRVGSGQTPSPQYLK